MADMNRHWTKATGPTYETAWGGIEWTLRLWSDRLGPLLALEGLSEVGRREVGAISARSLVGQECRFDRVEATYRPAGWGEMTVRAAWFPLPDEGIGLEVEMSARSVEELHRVEIMVLSALDSPTAGLHRAVEPRDREAAALSYDGRESDLGALVTGPPGEPIGPWLASKPGREGWAYLELIHPDDASRRISEGKLPFKATRYGLFGYDLERGVVLRGRMRGYWSPLAEAFALAEAKTREFLAEPPPLRT
jgi:hypothetical protein